MRAALLLNLPEVHCEPAVSWFDADLGHDLRLASDFRTSVEGLTCEPDENAMP